MSRFQSREEMIKEAEQEIRNRREERQRLQFRLNGEPPRCSTPGCNFSHPNRNQFRFRMSETASEEKARVFIFCLPCAAALYKKHGLVTGPYERVMRDRVATLDLAIQGLEARIEELQKEEKAEQQRLAKQEATEGEKLKLMEAAGEDFFASLGLKKEEEKEEKEEISATLVEEVKRPSGRKTNAQKKRERRANGAAPKTKPTSTEETVH
jgi:hypothetical protein